MSGNREWPAHLCAVALVFFALWFRLAYQAETIVDVPMRADAGQYVRIGWNILEHGVVSMDLPGDATPNPDSYRGPGYPLLVAFTFLIGGEEGWYSSLQTIQAVLGALSVALTILIARQCLSSAWANIAGILVAVWPHMVTLSGHILTETMFGFTVLLATYLLICARHSQRAVWYVLSGLAFAYSALINPSILLMPVFLSVLLFISKEKHVVLFLLCALILPLGWGLRGAMLPSDSSSGGRLMENVLVGMEPEFTYLETPTAVAARARVLAGLENYRQNRSGQVQEIFSRLAEHPAQTAKWYLLQKPVRLWQWTIVHGDSDIYVYPVIISPFHTQPFFRAIASVCHSLNPWLMLSASCCVLAVVIRTTRGSIRDQSAPLLFVTLMFLYATILHTVLTPDARYATPYRPFAILLAVSFVAMLYQSWLERSKVKSTGEVTGLK